MRYWDKSAGESLQIFKTNRYRRNGPGNRGTSAALILSCIVLVACQDPQPVAAEAAALAESGDAACSGDGYLQVELYGSIRASIDWQAGELSCKGMPRPDEEGARIRLSGPLDTGDGSRTLAFILGMPDLKIGETGKELPTNVTLIEEGTGRFFGSRDTGECWTDISSQEPVGDDNGSAYRLEGTLYCASPLAELNGNTSVTFTELIFSGRLNWELPK